MNLRIAVLALGTFAVGTDGFVIAGILPAIAHRLAVPVTTAGQLVTSFALAYALGSPVLASVTGTVARRPLLTAALALFALANGLAALASSFPLLLVARVLAAAGAALYTPAAGATAVGLVPPDRRGRALALVMAGMTVAIVLGVPLGTWVGDRFGWRLTFALVAVLGALAAIGVGLLLPTVENPPPVPLRSRLALAVQPRFAVALGLTTLWTSGGFSVYTYLAPLLQHTAHLGGPAIGGMLLLFGLAGVVGNALGGSGADRWGAGRTIVASLTVLAIVLPFLPVLARSAPGAALAVMVWGVAGWALQPPQQHRLLALAPASPGVILSLNGSAIYLGIGSGAAVGGLVLRFGTWAALGWTGGLCEALALGLFFLSTRRLQAQAKGAGACAGCTAPGGGQG